MKTLQIDEQKARELFPNASGEFKQVLEDSFGKEFFQQKITDRIKTFEDACTVLGINPKQYFEMSYCDALLGDAVSINANVKLVIIARALNEGWKPDWTNDEEYKWLPWFEYKAGFGLAYHGCDYWLTFTGVGSRLCFKTRELAEYAAKQFAEIYRDYLTL